MLVDSPLHQAVARSSRPTGGGNAGAADEGDAAGRSGHSPNAKGNFQFERVIAGWRDQSVLDLRRK